MTNREKKNTLTLINRAIKLFPKILKQKAKAHKEKERILKAFMPMAKDLKKQTEQVAKSLQESLGQEKVHPWRVCPGGHYFRRRHNQSSYIRSTGVQVSGSMHPNECVLNKTGKDQLYAEEIGKIAEMNFSELSGPPASNNLGYDEGDTYDALIRGWTKYWNEVLMPSEPLDADLVKALIATESSFHADPRRPKNDKLKARGLMQVTNDSRKMLSGEIPELKDHFVHVELKDMTDPNLNIAAGIRWLFRKKQIADAKGNKDGWVGGVLKYKAYTSLKDSQMQKLLKFYGDLKAK